MDRLRAMEFFLSVSRTQSFSETGRLFGVSATSVSRLITELENELKVKLLLRSTRQVVLNEAGRKYARDLEGILSSLNEAHNEITAIQSAPTGLLRLHARSMFGMGVLPRLIAEFKTLYPDIHIELILAERHADLYQQQIDIDFRVAQPVEAGLKRRILFRAERYLVASPKYVEVMPRLDAPEELAAQSCLAYLVPGDNYFWRYLTPQGIEEVSFIPRHVTSSGMVLLELARLGEGIALLDNYTVARDLEEGTLIRLLPDHRVTNTTFEAGIYATIIDTPVIPTKIRSFLDFAAERLSEGLQGFFMDR